MDEWFFNKHYFLIDLLQKLFSDFRMEQKSSQSPLKVASTLSFKKTTLSTNLSVESKPHMGFK